MKITVPDLEPETSSPSLIYYCSQVLGQPWEKTLVLCGRSVPRDLQENLKYTLTLYSGDTDGTEKVLGNESKRQLTPFGQGRILAVDLA